MFLTAPIYKGVSYGDNPPVMLISMNKEKENKDKFENIAKELECDESENALDKVMDKLDLETEKDEEQEAE